MKVRFDFMLFRGLDLHGAVPYHSTHCWFRNALVDGGVYPALLEEICGQLEDHGLKMAQAEAAIIGATLIESAARPQQYAALSATHVSEAMRGYLKLNEVNMALPFLDASYGPNMYLKHLSEFLEPPLMAMGGVYFCWLNPLERDHGCCVIKSMGGGVI